jgi:hypothetical protein
MCNNCGNIDPYKRFEDKNHHIFTAPNGDSIRIAYDNDGIIYSNLGSVNIKKQFNTFVVQTFGTEPEYTGTNVTFENWTHVGYASGYEGCDFREDAAYEIQVNKVDTRKDND